jgi:uncharacterized membrane protein YeiH
MSLTHLLLLASTPPVGFFKGWKFTGSLTTVDLIAASTNALNGALLARRPDHYKNFTVVGILGMGLIGGLTGGIARDLLLGKLPSALTNPAFLTLTATSGVAGYVIAYTRGQLFREGIFQFMTSFSLAWFAIVGAQAGIQARVPVLGCLLLAVISPTAGRWLIDVSCGVTPKQFIRGEWFLTVAALTGLVWILTYAATRNTWIACGVALVIGFFVRDAALWYGWEEPLASEPAGVYEHSDGRPLLGRKLKGKSKRELRDLGLVVEHGGNGHDGRRTGGAVSHEPSQTAP